MNETVFKRRVIFIILLFFFLSITFIVKLFSLHFSNKIIVPERKNFEYKRGFIKDRNGALLAMSVELHSVFANPQEITDPVKTSQIVSRIIGVSVESLIKKFNTKKKFVWLRRKIHNNLYYELKKLNLKGIYFQKEYRRVYPYGNLASNLLGFVGVDNIGLEGIEYNFDSELSGKNEDNENYQGVGELISGKNVVLTIDKFVQYISEKEIENAVRNNNAKQGMVIVLDTNSGQILSLAKYPNFDSNYYYNYSNFARRNFTVIDSFEPGSTLKIIALSALLDANPSIMKSIFRCDGKIDIADATINCTGIHGTLGITDVIRQSCNIGIIEAMNKIEKKQLYDKLKQFGFNQKTNVGMPGETDGILRHYKKWSGLSKYSISIGHEISVTSIQLAAAYGVIANDGEYIEPSIIKEVEENNGENSKEFKYSKSRRVIKKQTAEKLLNMMRKVVINGTGRLAASYYYDVAGKTGTSKKFIISKGSYSDRVISSFAGLAPYSDPGVCIVIVIDEPENKLSGGKIAAPVFSKIIDSVLPYLGYKNTPIETSVKLLSKNKEKKFNINIMPDFRGMNLHEVMESIHKIKQKYEIDYSFYGIGKVYAQKPFPGDKLDHNIKIIIKMAE